MARLYFSVVETVENEYSVDMNNEELQKYIKDNKKIKPNDIEQWVAEDRLELAEQVEVVNTDYSTLETTGFIKNEAE